MSVIPCSNCKESILNKTPTVIGQTQCTNDCPEDYICLDIIQAKCVSIQGKDDCITNAETVQGQIDNIRSYVCSHSSGGSSSCACTPGQYEITGICCTFIDEGAVPIFNIVAKPHFDWGYPLTLFVSVSTDSNIVAPMFISPRNAGIYYNTVDSVEAGTQLALNNAPISLVFGGNYSPQDGDTFIFQLTDNRGNYSNKYEFVFDALDPPTCG